MVILLFQHPEFWNYSHEPQYLAWGLFNLMSDIMHTIFFPNLQNFSATFRPFLMYSVVNALVHSKSVYLDSLSGLFIRLEFELWWQVGQKITLSSNKSSSDQTLALPDLHRSGPEAEQITRQGECLNSDGSRALTGLNRLPMDARVSSYLPQIPKGPIHLSQSISQASLNPADTTKRRENKRQSPPPNTARDGVRPGRLIKARCSGLLSWKHSSTKSFYLFHHMF